MPDWDLLTPGIGLTSIGIVGVLVSLSGIAKTFIDGMHAVSLLTLLIGMVFLTPGIFKDGFPSSRKAKLGSFITLGVLIIIGLVAAIFSSGQTPTIFVYIAILLLISVPEADSQEKKGEIPDQKPDTNIDITKLAKVTILPGSSAQGNPSYDPAQLVVKKDYLGINWVNQDNVPHTVTSLKDDGKSFDSSIIMGNANYTLFLSDLKEKEYDYFCTIHPYMKAKFQLE